MNADECKLYPGQDRFLDAPDPGLIALVENPLFDSLRPDQSGAHQDVQMLTGGRLGYAQLARDQHAADPIPDEISIALGREVLARVLQPFEDLKPALVGERSKFILHIDT